VTTQVIAGAIICGIGLAAMAGLIPALVDYTYPIVWWGLLPIVDAYNHRRRGLSLWRGRARQFLLITIPISVLFWLLFEALNLAAPQWRYKGGIDNLHAQVFFGFIAFATVIPIMVESYWLVGGSFCLPESLSTAFRRWRVAAIAIGLILAAIPFFNSVFWFNQGMWLAPGLVLLPFAKSPACGGTRRFAIALVASGLIAGFFWEMLNYWARTHWEYLILPTAPHLFQMPLLGYTGFIPFALTSMIVYERQLRLRARVLTGALLYVAALGALYFLTIVYMNRGLWLLK
jgi:hypothetical protein